MSRASLKNNIQYDSNISLIYKCLFVLMFAYILFYPHMITPLNVNIGRLNILLNIVAIGYISFSFTANNKPMLSWLLILVLIFSYINSTQDIEKNQFIQNVGSFLCLTFMIEGQNYIKIDERLVRFISYFNVVICLIFLVYSRMDFAYRFEKEGSIFESNAITLGYSNSNSTSMMLLYTAAINLISLKLKMYNKYFGIIIQAILIYLIYKTSSRTALLCILVLSFSSLFTIKKIPKLFLYIFTAIPTIYIFLLPYLKSIHFLIDTKLLGKSIYTGREEIFKKSIGYLETFVDWMFGVLSRGMFLNHHNGILSILLSVGLLGLIIYITIWYKNIIPHLGKTNGVSYIAIMSLMIILLQSSSETAFLVGSIPYGVMLVTLFIFVRYKDEADENTSY